MQINLSSETRPLRTLNNSTAKATADAVASPNAKSCLRTKSTNSLFSDRKLKSENNKKLRKLQIKLKSDEFKLLTAYTY